MSFKITRQRRSPILLYPLPNYPSSELLMFSHTTVSIYSKAVSGNYQNADLKLLAKFITIQPNAAIGCSCYHFTGSSRPHTKNYPTLHARGTFHFNLPSVFINEVISITLEGLSFAPLHPENHNFPMLQDLSHNSFLLSNLSNGLRHVIELH